MLTVSVQEIFLAPDKILTEFQCQSITQMSCRQEVLALPVVENPEKGMLHLHGFEVGHILREVFVMNDNLIYHCMGSVKAQWLCSAGGLSHWMQRLQPPCFTCVFIFFQSLLIPRYLGALLSLLALWAQLSLTSVSDPAVLPPSKLSCKLRATFSFQLKFSSHC